MQKLTFEQEQKICEIIDEWYFSFKNRLVNYQDKTHCFGFAKEELKSLICNLNKEEN